MAGVLAGLIKVSTTLINQNDTLSGGIADVFLASHDNGDFNF